MVAWRSHRVGNAEISGKRLRIIRLRLLDILKMWTPLNDLSAMIWIQQLLVLYEQMPARWIGCKLMRLAQVHQLVHRRVRQLQLVDTGWMFRLNVLLYLLLLHHEALKRWLHLWLEVVDLVHFVCHLALHNVQVLHVLPRCRHFFQLLLVHVAKLLELHLLSTALLVLLVF